MIIGSLYWDSDKDDFRYKLRNEYLEMSESRLVPAPIRYGRHSEKRDTYTMVFSMELCDSEDRQGQAYLIPIKNDYCSLEGIEDVAYSIINAEYEKEYENQRFNWGWGCLALLTNPNSDLRKLSSSWAGKYGNGFNPKEYKVGVEDPCVLKGGQLQIPWNREYDDYDFIIATATKPEIEEYPRSSQLIEKYTQDGHYFFGNQETKIKTFQDEEVLPALMEAKGYKHTKMGWIPEDWNVIVLGKVIAKTYSGGTPSRSKNDYYENGTIPWIKSGELNQIYIEKTEEYITEDALNNSSAKIVPKGTLLYALYGATAGVVGFTKIEAALNQAILAIETNAQKLLKGYLFFFLGFSKENILKEFTQGGQPNLSAGLVKGFSIPLPSLPEQKAIAQVLSTWDKAIEKLTQLTSLKEQKKKALMQQLLTGKKRFLGLNVEWGEYELDKLFKKVRRYVEWDEDKLYNLVSIKRRYGGLFYREKLLGKQIGVKKLKTIYEGDFLISKRQVSHGAWAVVPRKYHNGKVSDEYDCLELKDFVLINAFWKWYCQLPRLTHYAFLDSNGVHLEKLIFVFRFFKKRKVKIPKLIEEQKKIASVLNTADKEIKLLNQKLDALKDQKKGLMQQLLTGKKRIKSLIRFEDG